MTVKWNDQLFLSREQMREYDRLAIEEVGITGTVLMENAGRGAANYALKILAGKIAVSKAEKNLRIFRIFF